MSEPDAPTDELTDELIAAIRGGEGERVSALLDAHPELAAAADERGLSALMTAMYHRRPDLAEQIAARRDAFSLHEAVVLGRLETATAALDGGEVGIEDRSPDGFTSLHLAAFFGREELVAELLARGAEVDAVAENPMKVRPLHSAATIESVPICHRLLEAGADANACQEQGYTPLMSAALHGNSELAELLLAHGADPALRAEDGRSARDMASEGGYGDLAARLVEQSG